MICKALPDLAPLLSTLHYVFWWWGSRKDLKKSVTGSLRAPMGDCVWSRSVMSASVTAWTVVLQAPLVTGFSRKEYWSGLPCPPSGDLPDPGIEPASLKSPVLADGFFTISTTWEALRAPKGLKESKEKPAGSRKKDLTFQAESLAMLLPRASRKIKDAPIELDDPERGCPGRLEKVLTDFFCSL